MKQFSFTEHSQKSGAGGWVLAVILSLLLTGILGPLAVWVSIERNDISYSLRQIQSEIEAKHELSAKLEVERSRLLSPYELEKKAEILGMGMADPGQVRRLSKDDNSLIKPASVNPVLINNATATPEKP